MNSNDFLTGQQLRPVTLETPIKGETSGLALGQGSSALEVIVLRTTAAPSLPNVRTTWKKRNNRRASPLIVVVLHGDKATVCGPAGDDPPAYENVDIGQIDRICRDSLAGPDRHAALRYLRDTLQDIDTRLPGIRNEGFLATHELEQGAKKLGDWENALTKSEKIINLHEKELLKALGFKVEACDQVTSILRNKADDRSMALAVLLTQHESPELSGDRFAGLSPVSYALHVAQRENIPYVVLLQGSKLRLYPTKTGVGVGQRGQTETYVEITASLLRDSDAAYLWLLFSAEAMSDGGTLAQLIEQSRRFAGGLAENLRERIYERVVPQLAEGLARARGKKKTKAKDLAETYEMAMTVLFRLLFIAYAEDKDLLPYKWNGLYRSRSLKNKATDLLELHKQGKEFGDGNTWWTEVGRLYLAVDDGNSDWGVPKYNGGLFSRDPEVSKVGALLEDISLPDKVFGPVLRDLLLIGTPEGFGPVDFRSLGVREFGTIYEGLLESELSVAETDLTVDKDGYYRPCKDDEEPIVTRQHIYLHNRSGARKSSGAYFTKAFAVEHLLERSLDPALEDHTARLDKLNDDQAAQAFFDFRVADIAMGSGHFLVSAIDSVERALTSYIAKRPLRGVRAELAKLRAASVEQLASLADQVDKIEDTQLLRRLIARRCVYGVDLNPVSVNLARLSIWIHTFVPGLPLSLLDHNLVCGNSLVGIGIVDEISNLADDADRPMFRFDASQLVGDALEPLKKLAMIADSTPTEVRRARDAMESARVAVRPAEALCDIACACRLNGEELPLELEDWQRAKGKILNSKSHKAAIKSLHPLVPFHFPTAFPEVFLRERSGFDVIIGNPPWEEATVEEHAFWARHNPGLRSLVQREQERAKKMFRKKRPELVEEYESEVADAEKMRRALVTGPFEGMGTGDPDFYKAFCWRFWNLIHFQGGRLGIVLPRSALNAKGSKPFRDQVFLASKSCEVTMLVNNRQWVFPTVHPQYTIALFISCKEISDDADVALLGPYRSLDEYQKGKTDTPAEFKGSDVATWTDSNSLPLFPSDQSVAVFAKLREAPRLDLNIESSWRARPQTELHATNDKKHMDIKSEDCPDGFWPVYKGGSFDTWDADKNVYYAWAEPDSMIAVLQGKRVRGQRNRRSAFFEFPSRWAENSETHPCRFARIVFRDITRATDTRTLRAALIPPKVFATNKAPYFLWPRGDEKDQAFLLGVLCSLPLDWFARRFVETGMNFYVLNGLPVPRPSRDSQLWQMVVSLAGRLACPDEKFSKWADAVGVEHGPIRSDEKDDMVHELDSVVAHLYGLNQKQLTHIFETFHEGWDYKDRLKATLAYFRQWKGKS